MSNDPKYFTVKQFNRILYGATHAMVKYRKAMRHVDKEFQKQIMLAVSSVNNCRICSYVHTKALIRSGASDEELKSLYEGDFENLSAENSLALVFAQYYADQMGEYSKEDFDKLIEHYGKDKANGIMATIKIIMFGNNNGIALTNLVNRLRFKRNKNSKFLTELYNGLFAYVLLPLFLIVNLFSKRKVY